MKGDNIKLANYNKMKKSIWKFQLNPNDKVFVEMPKNAEILSVQTQKETPCIWALVDPNADKEERCFEVFETGHPVHYDMGVDRKFIGTFQLYDGDLVFHLFERLS